MSTTQSYLFSLGFFGMLLALIFYVVIGQVTVKKLRKNPETKHALGVEFASGWDILNVAQTLAILRSWSKKLESSPLSFLYAKSEHLRNSTTAFDRALAGVFYSVFTISTLTMITLVILNNIGAFN